MPSNVNEQPMNEEIILGARNRIKGLKDLKKENIDFYISSEAGLINIGQTWLNINLSIIEDSDGYESIGTSQGYMIPNNKIITIANKTIISLVSLNSFSLPLILSLYSIFTLYKIIRHWSILKNKM